MRGRNSKSAIQREITSAKEVRDKRRTMKFDFSHFSFIIVIVIISVIIIIVIIIFFFFVLPLSQKSLQYNQINDYVNGKIEYVTNHPNSTFEYQMTVYFWLLKSFRSFANEIYPISHSDI